MKAIGFFIIGVLCGLTVSELMKDKKPIVRHQDIYYRYAPRYPYGYDYPHYYRGGYDYYYRPLEYRGGGRNQSNTRNDGERRGGTERGETHTTTKEVNDRKKSWGTKY